MKHRLASFLLKYRTTPQTTTGYSPAELLMKRRLRTRISLVQPNLASKVEEKQRRQKHYFDSHKKERSFRPDDAVRVLSPPNKSSDNKWDVGKIVEVCGTKRYLVEVGDKIRSFHVDHMIPAHDEPKPEHKFQTPEYLPESQFEENTVGEEQGSVSTDKDANSSSQSQCTSTDQNKSTVDSEPVTLRRSSRIRKPVLKLDM